MLKFAKFQVALRCKVAKKESVKVETLMMKLIFYRNLKDGKGCTNGKT